MKSQTKSRVFDELIKAGEYKISMSDTVDDDRNDPIVKQAIAETRASIRLLKTAERLHKFQDGHWRQGDPRALFIAIIRARRIAAKRTS
jgi:hypothetical protein